MNKISSATKKLKSLKISETLYLNTVNKLRNSIQFFNIRLNQAKDKIS